MASCKDCLYCDVCCKTENDICKGNKENAVELYCESFKDTTRFVELPCRINDKVFQLCERRGKNKIVERIVKGVVFYGSCIILQCGTTLTLFQRDFGKTVFFTREEAEQVLKNNESRKNDIERNII